MHKGHRTELGCREEPILTPCWNCFFHLLFVAFVTIIIHTDLPQRTLSLFLTVKLKYQASQWLRIPKQRTVVWCLIQEDPMCPGATKLVHHYWASTYCRAHEPQLLSPHSITTEVQVPIAHASQPEKPLQWKAWALQQRVAPVCCNWKRHMCSNEDPLQPKN